MQRNNDTERTSRSRQATDTRVAQLASRLFTSIAQQPGVLTVNPEGDRWIELLCNISRIEEEDRGPLRSGARALAERCRFVAEQVEAILQGPRRDLTAVAAPTRYRCPKCKSLEVQLSFPVWVPANDMDNREHWDMDVEASPEKDSDKGWCPSCATNVLVHKEVT